MSEQPSGKKGFSRRGFLGSSLAAAAALSLDARQHVKAAAAEPVTSDVPRVREYRTLGRTGFKVSDISYGAGTVKNANVLSLALDRGVTYIDTAEAYGRGASERLIGEAMKGRNRKSVFINTKLWLMPNVTKEQIKERYQKSLERLGMEYADCLMIHGCSLVNVKHDAFHEAVRELKAENRLRFCGLSNHGADFALQMGAQDATMDQVICAGIEDGRFDVALFVYNYLNKERGEKILAACKAKNVGATLMKMDPAVYTQNDEAAANRMRDRYTKDGKDFPDAVKELLKAAEERKAATQAFLNKYGIKGPEQSRLAAVKYCLEHPTVACVLPGINTFEDVEAFLKLSGKALKAKDKALLSDYSDICSPMYCRHSCGECESACPQGVPVNTIMRYGYYYNAKGNEKYAMRLYKALGEANASPCENCDGHCTSACPHGVPIQGRLMLAHQTLT